VQKIYLILSLFVLLILSACSQNETQKKPEFMGYIENTQFNVTTRMPGKIIAINVDEGDQVKAGQVVAELDKRELSANINALKSQLKNINVNRKRVQHLYKAGAVPQQKLDEIETAYNVVTSKLAALNTRLEDMSIVSPIDGIVNVRILEVGQMMPPGMPVVIVTDTTATWARFSIPESYLEQISLGKVFNISTVGSKTTIPAKVTQIMPMADFATKTPTTLRDQRDVRSFSVKMKILNHKELCKPGIYVYLELNPQNAGGKTE